jgi:predicted RNA-binding Zn-ribbon protein involved in translation (DUF1610 family)
MNKEVLKNCILEEIKDDLEQFKNENLICCPNCDKITKWDDVNYNPEENEYTCPNCQFTTCETDFFNVSILDYIEEIYLSYKTKYGDEENE